ncbi:uncharacterized protein L3040_004050 [Drepanopeziza brunnea f. sp. 'multigermtubi']|uniref:uncharacterized protein n=1 Tax=Drepanopeziza brunnea f. sp. 'multigermtubi' TaxID=698441 RepID=UPI00239A33BE|nr:hypothetical protein L3040_004050 [Drepanopeziza brunnea f. sp. 'multigermtubi']
MGKNRKEKLPQIPLAQADRSGPKAPTLLDIAEQRGILRDYAGKPDTASLEARDRGNDEKEALVGRLGDSILWSISLTMLHFTLDVLVTHQYNIDGIVWPGIIWRTVQALPVILLLMYSLHQHPSPSPVFPPLSKRVSYITHQSLFFVAAVSAGCYLIHVTNEDPYYAVMKQAPALGCLWIWSVIELDVLAAGGSLCLCIVFLKYGGYTFL